LRNQHCHHDARGAPFAPYDPDCGKDAGMGVECWKSWNGNHHWLLAACTQKNENNIEVLPSMGGPTIEHT